MHDTIKQAIVAHLSGVAKYKSGTQEIEWEDEGGKPITVESLGKKYVVREYWENCNLQSETPYHEGKRHGVVKWYYDNGNLQSETPCHEGKIHGVEKYYYDSGNLQYETPCHEDKIHGVVKRYWESGKLYQETPYHEDKVHGVVKRYDVDGKLEKKALWENGIEQMVGILHQAIVAHLSGVAKYKSGTQEIEWEDEDGKPLTVENLGDEKYIVRRYWDNGNLQYETPYRRGKLHGVEKWYYENGKLSYETPYHEGKLHGVEKRYYLDGKLEKKVLWENGIRQ